MRQLRKHPEAKQASVLAESEYSKDWSDVAAGLQLIAGC